MRYIKLTLLALIVLGGTLLIAAPRVRAAETDFLQAACDEAKLNNTALPPGCDQQDNGNPISGSQGILKTAIQLLITAVGVVSVFAIILGGIQYAISTGDPAKINRAKDTILYAVIGIAVAAVAQSIIIFVIDKL